MGLYQRVTSRKSGVGKKGSYRLGGISSELSIENLQPSHMPLGLSVLLTPQVLQFIYIKMKNESQLKIFLNSVFCVIKLF